MTAFGGAAPSPGERPVISDPSEAYATALSAERFKSDLTDEDAARVFTAVCDLSYPAGSSKVPRFPSEAEIAYSLQYSPSLPDIHLAAARLEGRGASSAGRLARGVGSLAGKVFVPLQDMHSRGRSELLQATRGLVRRVYGLPGYIDAPAPYLWGIIIRQLSRSGDPITAESWGQLVDRFVVSYDRSFVGPAAGSVPFALRGLRLAVRQLGTPDAVARYIDGPRR